MSSIQPAPPCTIVVFGAAGDLTKRLLMPAIYNLAGGKLLDDGLTIVGLDHHACSTDDWRTELDEAFQSFTKETWLATARVRFGYAVNNLLFYGTGGYAAAGVEAGVKDASTNALLASGTSTRSGWAAGGGLEWGFAPNWSAKFELLYTQFEDKPFFTLQAEGPRSAIPLNDTAARFGINYRFGGPTVVAKY